MVIFNGVELPGGVKLFGVHPGVYERTKITSDTCVNNTDFSIAYGRENFAGYKAHKITAYDNEALLVTLDSDASTLAVGDEVWVIGGDQCPHSVTVTAVDGHTVTVSAVILDSTGAVINPAEDEFYIVSAGKTETGNNATYTGQVTFGLGNHAVGEATLAIGKENYAICSYAIALGEGNLACSFAAMALGRGNKIYASHALGVGHGNEVYGDYSVAVGQQHKVSGYYAFAAGFLNDVRGKFSAALGRQLITNAEFQVAVGAYNAEDAEARFVVGIGTNKNNRINGFVVKKDGSATLYAQGDGNDAVVRKQYVVEYVARQLIGYTGKEDGISLGEKDNTVSHRGIALGGKNTVSGTRAFGCGYSNTVTGPLSGTFGEKNTVGGDGYNFAAGFMNEVLGKFAAAFGRGLKVTAEFQVAVGAYNAEDAEARFMVGIGGNANARRTAFAVKNDGTATLYAQGETDDSVVRVALLKQEIAALQARIEALETAASGS